jgi:amino acid transporter
MLELWGVPRTLSLIVLVIVLTATAAWGVAESVRIAAAVTVLEILGLGLVLWVTRGSWASLPEQLPALIPPADFSAWAGIGAASILAFYAFLGFEDMVNVAEEVVDVRRTLPLAIGITLVVTTVVYGLLATAAVLTLPPAELARSDAPLALLYGAGGGNPKLLGAIAVIAVVNGALIQIIMSARVVYGLSSRGALPSALARIHPRTRTPILATAVVGGAVIVLALGFPLAELAEVTALIAMAVFALVNLALVRVHRIGPPPEHTIRVPRWVPIIAAGICLSVLIARLVSLVV